MLRGRILTLLPAAISLLYVSHLLLLPTWLSHYLVVHTHTLTHIFTHIPRTHSQEPPLPVWAQILIPPLHPQIHHLVLCLQDSRLLRSDGMLLDEGSNERPLLISLWPFSKERSEELLAVHFPGSVPYLVLICQWLGPWDTTHLLNRSGWRLKMVPAPLLDAWKWSSGLIPQQCSVLFLPQPEMNRVALTLPSYFFPETQKLFERRSRVFLSLGEAPCYGLAHGGHPRSRSYPWYLGPSVDLGDPRTDFLRCLSDSLQSPPTLHQ